MALDRKLADWQAAGLIDPGTAAAIAAHEAAAARPMARWAAIAIGLLALALGGTLVVAANWDAIPKAAKLGVHGLLLAGAALAAWRAGRPLLREGALFLLGALVLAGLSLQDQIYQIPQPLWSLLGTSALLVGPAVLVAGRTRLTAIAWSLLLTATALAYAGALPRGLDLGTLVPANLIAALPPALLLLALLLPADRGAFAAAFRDVGLSLLLVAASLVHLAWATRLGVEDALAMWARLPLALLLAAAVVALAGRAGESAPLIRTCVVASAAAVALAIAVPHPDALIPRLIGALIYLGLWGLVARAASVSGWQTLFGWAVAMIACRLFLIYFELFGTLASTGLGLVAGGALLIGLALAWGRIVRRRPQP